jgi:hypothetical protein
MISFFFFFFKGSPFSIQTMNDKKIKVQNSIKIHELQNI